MQFLTSLLTGFSLPTFPPPALRDSYLITSTGQILHSTILRDKLRHDRDHCHLKDNLKIVMIQRKKEKHWINIRD